MRALNLESSSVSAGMRARQYSAAFGRRAPLLYARQATCREVAERQGRGRFQHLHRERGAHVVQLDPGDQPGVDPVVALDARHHHVRPVVDLPRHPVAPHHLRQVHHGIRQGDRIHRAPAGRRRDLCRALRASRSGFAVAMVGRRAGLRRSMPCCRFLITTTGLADDPPACVAAWSPTACRQPLTGRGPLPDRPGVLQRGMDTQAGPAPASPCRKADRSATFRACMRGVPGAVAVVTTVHAGPAAG